MNIGEFAASLGKKLERRHILIVADADSRKAGIINPLLEKMGAQMDDGVEPKIQGITIFNLDDKLYFHDTLGYGYGIKEPQYRAKINDILSTAHPDEKNTALVDLVLMIVDGSKNGLNSVTTLIKDAIKPVFPTKRILIAINQANQVDACIEDRHWEIRDNQACKELENWLVGRAWEINSHIFETTALYGNTMMNFSTRHDLNIQELLEQIIREIPADKYLFPANQSTTGNKPASPNAEKKRTEQINDMEKLIISSFERYFFRECEGNSNSIYLKSHRSAIKQKTIDKLIRNVADDRISFNDVILLVDPTFHNADRGMIITKDRIYYKSDKDSGVINLKDLDGVYTERKFFGDHIVDLRDKNGNWRHLGAVTALKDRLEALDSGFSNLIAAIKKNR